MKEDLVKSSEIPTRVRKALGKYKGVRYELRPVKAIKYKLFVYGLPKAEQDKVKKEMEKTGVEDLKFESIGMYKIRETIRNEIKLHERDYYKELEDEIENEVDQIAHKKDELTQAMVALQATMKNAKGLVSGDFDNLMPDLKKIAVVHQKLGKAIDTFVKKYGRY